MVLLTSAYTYSASHTVLSDITDDVATRVHKTTSALLSGTTTDGALDHADFEISSLSGSAVTQLVVYVHNASESSAKLVYLMTHASTGSAINKTPTGGVFTVKPNTAGWFKVAG